MVAKENWAQIEGEVLDVKAHPSLRDFQVVQVKVQEVTPVGTYPNLFEWAEGRVIEVNFPASCEGVRPGVTVRCQVRKNGPKADFAKPESVSIQ